MSDLHTEHVLENEYLRFSLDAYGYRWQLVDKRAGTSWGNQERGGAWLLARRSTPEGMKWLSLSSDDIHLQENALLGQWHADQYEQDPGLKLAFRLKQDALQVYLVPEDGAAFTAVRTFWAGLEGSDQEGCEALVPVRMGLLVPAAGDKPFQRTLGTYEYEGVHLAMAGMLKSGAALLAAWGDPYVTLDVARTLEDDEALLRLGFTLTKTARSLQLRCLGPGDLSTLADAYREQAVSLGYRVPWEEKLEARPNAARLFGASNVKLWTALARRIDENLVEQSVEVKWTFDEAAQIAEHLKRDLELDNVLFHLGGWTRYGYDCKHPDIMPANPECGGNEGLLDCVRRVQACGYLMCLHDNVQDMYRDAPSWDEACLQKEPDGSPHLGGVWLGGQAYYTCAREAVKLAQRPQNLPLVRDTFHPDLYFIDTTYAVGPQECYDPRHPLTRQDDIHWKQVLSDYARGLFGLFGSECGREWAVPHADFFEGLASVSGRYYHRLDPDELGARVVPFFDMLFHDCVALHGKYGYDPAQMGEQVIHHVAMGRTLYYHALGAHLYWQDKSSCAEQPLPQDAYDPAVFTRAHNGWAEGLCLWDRFIKNTHEVLAPLYARTAQAYIQRYQFLDGQDPAAGRLVRKTTFSNAVTTVVNGSEREIEVASSLGSMVRLPPYGFLVEAGTFVAFHARSWGGHTYSAPVLFALTSQDGKPLDRSTQVRVYHGFGESSLRWKGRTVRVQRETVL
jgi:hypothetical protein